MFQWIQENLSTMLIALALALLAGLAITYLIRQKKKGKCLGCASNCAKCQQDCAIRQPEPLKKA